MARDADISDPSGLPPRGDFGSGDRIRPVRVLRLDQVEAPLVLCSGNGAVLESSTQARELLTRFRMVDPHDRVLPDLWNTLGTAPLGQALEWRVPDDVDGVLGCTRYRVGDRYLLLMKEVSEKQIALSRRLHRQRLEMTGRLMASIAHELRSSVASVVYSVDFLAMLGPLAQGEVLQEGLREVSEASTHLQRTVDGLLAYARVGPTLAVPVSLRDVLTRARGFLRGFYGEGSHALTIDIPPSAEWVRGNSLSVEQIFVNLLLNAAEAAHGVVNVSVVSELMDVGERETPMVRVRVRDDGPGVASHIQSSIFQPFFTTREDGTGLGLPNAVEAAESLDGRVVLEPSAEGACFAVYLPQSPPCPSPRAAR